jgi:hypothetical protein
MLRRVLPIAIVGAALLTLAGPVDAARGGNRGGGDSASTGSSSIVLEQAAPVVYGQPITFSVATSATDRPFSRVNCFQQGLHVYQSSRGHFQDYYDYFGDPVHYLSSLAWPTGDADCTAELIEKLDNGKSRTLASTTFVVDG